MSERHSIVDIIIVNWNAGSQLQSCLAALSESRGDGYQLGRVVLVDNASTDGSLDKLCVPRLPLIVIRNSTNRGFGAACNQGALGSTADYLLFLNPDTRILPDTLARSIDCMKAPDHFRVGVLGVQLLNSRGTVSRTCARFLATRYFVAAMFGLTRLMPHRALDVTYSEWDHMESQLVEHVIGAYYLIRRPLFEEVGGFDERFFVYFEDVDLSLRVAQAGWTIYYLATAQCHHTGGGTSEQVRAKRLFYSLKSRLLYAFKHFGPANAIALLLATLVVEPFSRIGGALMRRSWKQVPETVLAYGLLLSNLPQLLKNPDLRKRTNRTANGCPHSHRNQGSINSDAVH